MGQLAFDFMGGVRLVLPIVMLIVFGSLTAISFLGSAFKQALLSQDRDGWRLLMLGSGAVVLAVLARTGTNMVAFAAFGATLIVFGGAIWLNVTDVLLKPALGWVYLVLAAVSFGYGAFWGAESIAFNAIGLTTLVIPVGSAVLFGSLAVFALLSEDFKMRILPQNGDGGRLMNFGLAFLIIAMFSSNPVMLVAAATFSATLVVLGGLVLVPEGYTNFLLKTWMAPMYGLFAVALFVRAADFFTSAVVCAVLLFVAAIFLAMKGVVDYGKSFPEPKPRLYAFWQAIVYGVVALLLVVWAVAGLLVH